MLWPPLFFDSSEEAVVDCGLRLFSDGLGLIPCCFRRGSFLLCHDRQRGGGGNVSGGVVENWRWETFLASTLFFSLGFGDVVERIERMVEHESEAHFACGDRCVDAGALCGGVSSDWGCGGGVCIFAAVSLVVEDFAELSERGVDGLGGWLAFLDWADLLAAARDFYGDADACGADGRFFHALGVRRCLAESKAWG